MASTRSGRKYWSTAGKILLLLIAASGASQSGPTAAYLDSYGILFVLVGGVALVLISFPGAEIWRALRHAAGGSGSDAELGNSAHFWEAAGRSFWILGGLRSVLSIIIGFESMASQYSASMSALIPMLVRTLLSTFYGSLLAVICFVPCWKLMGQSRGRLSVPEAERSETQPSIRRPGWSFGTIIGYVIFLAALISTIQLPNLNLWILWTVFRPSFLVVLGGTLALMLFAGWNTTKLTPSAAFAGMGFIGSLMGFIQMLHGMTDPTVQGISHVAGALVFVLSSCFTALLGMAVIGAPLEDRAVRAGRISVPSAFSRVSWYVFPLLSLIFLILVFNMIILPLPASS